MASRPRRAIVRGASRPNPPQSVFTELPSNTLLMRRVVEGGWNTSSETEQRHSSV